MQGLLRSGTVAAPGASSIQTGSPMETTAYIALSRQMVLRRRVDVLANNIANATTTAFKAEQLLLEPVIARAGTAQRLAFVQDVATVRDPSPGPLTATGNPLDLAIEGEGYFTIETADGVRYGRSGQFRLSDAGEMVTAAGDLLLDDGGAPLALPLGARTITLAPDGTLSTEEGVAGRIEVVGFADEQALRKVGSGLYVTDQAPEAVPGARLVQGMLEGANVQPVVEMTEMIATLRAYQGTERLLETHHELQRRAIERMLDIGP
jgi:flagellar basal-body rod protein FlgF